jgi:hypothetical protein
LQSKLDDIININPTPPENYGHPLEKQMEFNPVGFNRSPLNYRYKKTGYDERYEILYEHPNRTEVLYNISQNIRKLNLLMLLQHEGVSAYEKVLAIETYEKTEGASPLSPNIYAGGLFDAWNNE